MTTIAAQANHLLGSGEVTAPPGTEFRSDEDREVYRAALEFERIFVKQMLAEMEKANKLLAGGDETPGMAATSGYQDMVTDNLADSIASGGGLGLAAVLWGQLRPEGATA